MIKWEYTTLGGTFDEVHRLNELGKKGWEVIAVATERDQAGNQLKTFYLKRRSINGEELIEG